ncbi:hypothetical protein [Sneathiella aquimaris]|uniref:hypothetical protein n=1 Tax=Sneathiella aquimaris TaxID=2599305 RepID=UPI00146CA28B|nr:hypothetical protein [Sneathiella aquimaris]
MGDRRSGPAKRVARYLLISLSSVLVLAVGAVRAQQTPSYYQNSTPSYSTGETPTTGGGYATQAGQAQQAGQAKQATQAQGYKSPYSNVPTTSGGTSTTTGPSILLQSPNTLPGTTGSSGDTGTTVDYYSSKGTSGTYVIPKNLVPPKPHPNAVLQGEIVIQSDTDPELNETITVQGRPNTTTSPSPTETTAGTSSSAPATLTAPKQSLPLGAVTQSPSRLNGGNAPTVLKETVPSVTETAPKTTTSSTPEITTGGAPTIKTETETSPNTPGLTTGSGTQTRTETKTASPVPSSTEGTPETVVTTQPTTLEKSTTGMSAPAKTESGGDTAISSSPTPETKALTSTEKPSDAPAIVNQPAVTPETVETTNNASSYDQAAKKAEEEALRKARREEAGNARLGSKERAQALLNQSPSHMNSDQHGQQSMVSDTPRAPINFGEINALSASIGQFIRQGIAMASLPSNVAPEEDEPVCAAPEIADELQEQLDKEKKELKEALRKAREELEKKKKKLADDKKADEEIKNRKKLKDAQKKLNDRFKELSEDRQKLSEERDALDDKKEKSQEKYDDARRKESEARKGPPADPNCRSANCRKHRTAQADARKALNEVQKGEQDFQRKVRDFERTEREYQKDANAFEDALDRGYGQSKDQWKERMLKKQDQALRDQRREMEKRIKQLETKAKGNSAAARQDKNKLKQMERQADDVRKQRKAAQDYIDRYADSENGDFDKIMKARGIVEQADKFIRDLSSLKNGVEYQDSYGRGLNSGEARELDRLKQDRNKITGHLENEKNGPSYKARDLREKMEKDGVPTMQETLSSFGGMLDTDARDKKLAALEQGINDLKAAEDRVQNFKGQPNADAHKQAVEADKKAQAQLKDLTEQREKFRSSLPTRYPDQSAELNKAKKELGELENAPNSSWRDRQNLKEKVEKLERAQERHKREFAIHNRQVDEKFGDKVRAAETTAELSGYRALGAKGQQIVSDYNRGLPDVFGADGKVDPLKVGRVAAQIDKQLNDLGQLNGELGRLNQVRSNLVPGEDGAPSLAAQAGMSQKAIDARLKDIDTRIQKAGGYRDQVRAGLTKQGFVSDIQPTGQCQINSVNSAMGAAYVKGTRAAAANQKNNKGKKVASASGAPQGTASPAANAVAKNISNVQQAKQAQQYKMPGSGGGQCVGSGAPKVSCSDSQAKDRGRQMAGRINQASTQLARAAGSAIGGAVSGAIGLTGENMRGLAIGASPAPVLLADNQGRLHQLEQAAVALDAQVALFTKLKKGTPETSIAHQVFAQQHLVFKTAKDALLPEIAALKGQTKTPPAAAQTAAVQQFEQAIDDIDGHIAAVETMMASVQGSGIPGLLGALDGQRNSLFAGRDALQKKMDALKSAAKQPEGFVPASTTINTPQAPSKDPIIEQDKIKEIVKVLDKTIQGVSQIETGFKEGGQPIVAQVFTNQRAALQAVRDTYLAKIKRPPSAPAGVRAQVASLRPQGQQALTPVPSPEKIELERTRQLIDWINTGLMPAFEKTDKMAQKVLPRILVGLIKQLGATAADEVIDETADFMEDNGLKPTGALFIDALMKRAAAVTAFSKTEEQILVADLARAHFLKQALLDKDNKLGESEKDILMQSSNELRNSLNQRLEGQLKGLDNKPDEMLQKLAALAEIASLPGQSAKSLKPLLDQITRQLARLEKGEKILDHSGSQTAVQRLKQSLTALQKSLPANAEFQSRNLQLSNLLERVNGQLARIYDHQKTNGESLAGLNGAKSRLDQSHQAMRGGNFKKALDLINQTASDNPSVKLARSVALIDTVNNLERVYPLLPQSQRDQLGPLKDLTAKRDTAIATVLEISTNPKLVSTLLLGNAERLARAGKFAEAKQAIETALVKNPGDEALIGSRFKIELLSFGDKIDEKMLADLIAKLPQEARLSGSLIALNDLISSGGFEKTAGLLIKQLREMKDIPKDVKDRFDLQVEYADISLQSSKLGLGADEQALKKQLLAFKTKLATVGDLDTVYRKALEKAANGLIEQINQGQSWAQKLAQKEISLSDLMDIVRRSIAAGRYDIAGPALQAQMKKLIKEAGPKDIQIGLQQATRLLDSIRLRMNGEGVSAEQRKILGAFLKDQGAIVSQTLNGYLQERIQSAGKSARNAVQNKKPDRSSAAYRFEIRQLAGLKIRLDLLQVPEKDRVRKMNELRMAANKAIQEYDAQIRSDFSDRGLLLRDKDYDKARLAGAIAELNQLRAVRDGMDDYWFDNAGQYSAPDTRGELWYGRFLAKTHREAAMKAVQRELAGVYAYGRSATEIWDTRKNYSMTAGRGLREKTIANHKNDPRDREYEANPEKYKDFWLEMALDDAKLAYKDSRRAELINEDPTRSTPEKAKLYDFFVTAEAKYLRALVGSSNPLLEMFEKLAQTGRLMTGAAKDLEARVAINDKNQLLNEYQSALLDEDPQRLFRALVPLRDASLAGEINAFVNYLHGDWTSAGPARAYNLLVGMDATQEALEQITAESQKVQIALIRAGANLPGQLSDADRTILTRHGFLTDGKYTIPEQIKLDPTKVGTEFVNLTKKGPLATVDRFLNAKQGAELFATVALPGGIAGKFGRAVTMEMLALGGVRTLGGKALAYGTGLAVEAGAFTALNRGARIGLDPTLALQDQFWSRETIVKEYAHNLLIIGALKGFGKTAQELGKRARGLGSTAAAGKSYARALENVAFLGEAGLLTAMNGLLEGNQISQDDYLGNLLTIVLLKGTNKVLEGGEKSASTRLQEARINKILSYMGKGPVPGTGPTTRVSQLREAQIRELNYQNWLQNVDKPARILLETYGGNWDAARKAFQKGELSAANMRKLTLLRKDIVDSLANEIVRELGGEVQAFGSENLTSDYDISFVGPKAQLAVIIFNARFASRWGKAAQLGGRETGVVLDTNAYTETIQSLIEQGRGDSVFQDAFAHMANRKYLSDANWAKHRALVLEKTPEALRADVQKVLDFAESAHRDFKTQIQLKMAELSADKENPVRESDLQITAENRLYEDALKDILALRAKFEKATGVAKEALRQQLRNAQSKALYFAQEAYHTQGAIEHVVMSIQAAKRKITVESLTSDTPPKLKIELTPDQGRQSYVEQIANMMKEILHEGDAAKLASKGAKYFIRALDAAQIAGIKLAEYRALIEQVVALDANRADLAKVREILAEKDLKTAEEAKGVELTAAERTAIENAAAQKFLQDIQLLSNELTGKLYDGQTLRVVEKEGLGRLAIKTEAMNTRDIIENIDRPTQTLMERFKGNWNKARKAYQTGELSAVEMRLLVNLRRRIVDSLAAEIIKELGGEVEAFGSENLTSDYDISFVGPKAQLAVILFNARFAAGWGQAAKIGGRETGTVLDTNAYTETIQSLIKAGKGDITYQDAFSHLAGRKYMDNDVWQAHRDLILQNTPQANRINVEIMLRWVEASNDVFRAQIEARKKQLLEDPNSNTKPEDAQITAENRLYEEALQDILHLREQFEKADATGQDALRLKLRNAQSRALYFAQEAYHTQGAIEHVVMSLQAAKRSITVESLLSDTPPTLKKPLTTEQGRQSYFEQVANMLKEILHDGDPVKLASKGAKYFVRALDAAQIAGLKLGNLKSVVEMTVALNDNRANLDRVRDILSKDALAKARAEKGSALTEAEIKQISDQAAQGYLDAIQKAANQLTADLYKNHKLEGTGKDAVAEMKLELPEPANDNLPFSGEKVALAEGVVENASLSRREAGPSSDGKTGAGRDNRSALENETYRTQRALNFTGPNGREVSILLGEYVAKGATSYVYRHLENPDWLIRIIKSGARDAQAMDSFGRDVLQNEVDTQFVRGVKVHKTLEATQVGTKFFESNGVRRIEIVEFMKQGTAEDLMARPEQNGSLTDGQRIALDQGTRELNRKGYAWLDNKPDNYTFERVVEGKDLWRLVIIDPGGIVPMSGKSAYERYVNAHELQGRINLLEDYMIELLGRHKGAPKFVVMDINKKISADHKPKINFQALGIEPKNLAYSPIGYFNLRQAQNLFAMTAEAANQNYENHVRQQMASGQ